MVRPGLKGTLVAPTTPVPDPCGPLTGLVCRVIRHLPLRWWLVLFMGVLPALLLPARAGDLLRSQAVLADPGGQWNIDQVAASPDFQPFEGVFVGGYSDGAFWLRLQVDPSAQGQPLKLRVRPTFVDEVRLYQPLAQGGWQVVASGDRHPFESAPRSLNALGFDIAPQGPTTYYLRLQTTSSAMLHVQALEVKEAARKDMLLLLAHMAYLAFMTSVFMWAVHAYWRAREPVMGTFALYQINNLVFALAFMGYLSPLEPGGWAGGMDRVTSAWVLIVSASGFIFHGSVLQMYEPHRGLLLALRALALWVLVEGVLYALGHHRLALEINAMAVLASGPLMLALAWSTRRDGQPGLRFLRAVYLLQCLSVAATMVPYLGWIQAVELSMQSSLIHGWMSACLMLYMLDRRARRLRAQTEADRLRALQAEQRLQLQSEQVAAQQQFIDVLTHELKTPISVAMMSLGTSRGDRQDIERARRAMTNLDAIVERTRLSFLADSRRLEPQLAPANVSVLAYECIEDARSPQRIQSRIGFELEAVTDAQLLGLIITNLIDNALKYSPADSRVEVSLVPEPDGQQPCLCLRVANVPGAAGLPDEGRLFEKYYRSPGAQSQSGSGLGLYLSHHLAGLLGARLGYRHLHHCIEFALYIPTRGLLHP